MSRPRRPASAALLLAVFCLVGCAGSGTGSGEPDSGSEPASFRVAAARACTQAVNDHLVDEPVPAGVSVLRAIVGEQQATAEEVAGWHEAFADEVERLEAIVGVLGGLASPGADEDDWHLLLADGTSRIALAGERRDLLAGGEWERIKTAFPPASGAAVDGVADALVRLGLDRTDCAAVFDAGRDVAGDDADFERQTSAACVETWARRSQGDFDEHRRSVVAASAVLREEGGLEAVPDGLEESLAAVVEEWQMTYEDFGTVTAEPPHGTSWNDVRAAARERVAVHSARLEALRTGEPDALVTAFDTGWKHPGLPFAEAGMDRTICAGLDP